MRIFDYICLMIILMAVGFVYRRYVDKYESDDELQQYNLIKDIFLMILVLQDIRNLLSGFIYHMNTTLEVGHLLVLEAV